MKRLAAWTALSLACLLIAGCGQTRTEREVEVGFYGEARYNHYLAGARFLEKMGIPARSVPKISELPPSDTLLILPYETANTQGMAQELSEWAWNGGHAIIPLGAEPSRSPWYIQDQLGGGLLPDDDDADPVLGSPLLDIFEVEQVETGFFTNGQIAVRGDLMDVELPANTTFKMENFPPGTYSNGDTWQSSFLSIQHGAGRITLLADPQPFLNRHIGEADHARLLWRLAQAENSVDAVLVYGSGLSFLGMLIKYGWMPLLSLLMLTIFWLMRNMPRFGPVMRPEPTATRQFDEHIRSSGTFLWSKECGDELCDPLRRRIRSKLNKRYFSGPNADDPLTKLAELTGVPEHDIRDAMETTDITDPELHTRTMQTLQTLDASI